jgi:F-type H+-transporting ATPase subunit b
MQIDPFTFIAQIINFIILLVLLKYFLYNKILGVMEQREENIKNRIHEAEEKKREAETEKAEYREEKRKVEENKEEILSEAREKAREKKEEMLKDARKEIESKQNQWRQSVEKQREIFISELQKKAGKRVFSISRQVLKDLADSELEHQMTVSFLKYMENLEKDKREFLEKSYETTEKPVVLESTFILDEEIRGDFSSAVKKLLGQNVQVNFEKTEDIICGLILHIDGEKISWNIDSYLEGLKDEFMEFLKRNQHKEAS